MSALFSFKNALVLFGCPEKCDWCLISLSFVLVLGSVELVIFETI